jgi:hypothetical protein
MEVYRKLGLHLGAAENAVENAVEAGITLWFRTAESDGEADELVPGVSEVSPR